MAEAPNVASSSALPNTGGGSELSADVSGPSGLQAWSSRSRRGPPVAALLMSVSVRNAG